MNAYDRVRNEHAELSTKVEALEVFIAGDMFDTISPMQQKLLPIQLGIMKIYARILALRIEMWEGN